MHRKALTSDSLSTHGFFWAKTSHPPLYRVVFDAVYCTDGGGTPIPITPAAAEPLYSAPCALMKSVRV